MADDIIREARAAFEAAQQHDQANRAEALIDLQFAAGEQWDPAMKAARESAGKPCLTSNRLPQYIRQITGDARLNPPASKVRAVDGKHDPKLAEIRTGLIRHIEARCNATDAYIHALENAVVAGEGFWRITTEYPDDDCWEQDIGIERIPSPFGAIFDPASIKPTREDAMWGFVFEQLPVATFKARFPEASDTGFDSSTAGDWTTTDSVRVAEYWRKVPVTRKLLRLVTGATLDVTERERAEVVAILDQLKAATGHATGYTHERKAQSHRVEMRLLNGVEELAEPTRWAGRYIPIVRVWGTERWVGDRVVRSGLVRDARDEQRMFNVMRSVVTEVINTAPRAKWLVTPKMIAGYETLWQASNTSNTAYLPFNLDPAAPGAMPQRVQPEMPPAGLLQEVQLAAQGIEATVGIYRENLGKESNAQSGKAILSRQREGDVSTFHFADNLAQAVSHSTRIILDLLPHIYDTERTIRVLGEDGAEDFAVLNQTLPDGTVINDVSQGRYDVVASVGPSFSTKREQGAEAIMTLIQANPADAPMVSDLLVKSLDVPYGDEMAKRYRKRAVAQGIAEPEEGEPPPPPPKPDPMAMAAQAEMMKAQAAGMKAQADAQLAQVQAQIKIAELQLEERKLAILAAQTGADIQVDRGKLQLEGIRTAADLAGQQAAHIRDARNDALNHAQAAHTMQRDRRGDARADFQAMHGAQRAERQDAHAADETAWQRQHAEQQAAAAAAGGGGKKRPPGAAAAASAGPR